jgi:hypothetical protein
VADLWDGVVWGLTFRRSLNQAEVEEWQSLGDVLDGVSLNNDEDVDVWQPESKKNFSTSSLYSSES